MQGIAELAFDYVLQNVLSVVIYHGWKSRSQLSQEGYTIACSIIEEGHKP